MTKRQRLPPTDDWQQLRLLVGSPAQETYELLRPIVLFGQTAAERAEATGVSDRTLDRKADRFDAEGMTRLFPTPAHSLEDRRRLPADIRHRILALKAEYPAFRPHEIAEICRRRGTGTGIGTRSHGDNGDDNNRDDDRASHRSLMLPELPGCTTKSARQRT